jgi:hypothetical protein
MGCVLTFSLKNILSRDLKSRTSMVDLEMDEVKDYNDLKMKYASLIKSRKYRTLRQKGKAKSHFNAKSKIKCFNCNQNGQTVEKCRNSIGKCDFCHFYGYRRKNAIRKRMGKTI